MTAGGFEARCGCGDLTVLVSGLPVLQVVCHCNDCREVTGEPFTRVVFFPLVGIATRGATHTTEFFGASGNTKHYVSCARCDEFLYGEVAVLGGVCGIRPRSLGPKFTFAPSAHVWVSQRDSTVHLDDDLPAFERAPGR